MISCERRHYLCNFSYQTVASDSNDILNCLDKHFDSLVHSCFFFWIILVTQVYMHRMVYEIDFRKVFINKNRLHSICKSNKWVFYIRTLQHNFYISINFINSKFPLFLCLQYDAHTHFVVSYWTQFGTDTHTILIKPHWTPIFVYAFSLLLETAIQPGQMNHFLFSTLFHMISRAIVEFHSSWKW